MRQVVLKTPSLFMVGESTLDIVRDRLMAEYRFDAMSGQILVDYSGNGNHGTLGSMSGVDLNDPTWSTDGLNFASDEYVSIPSFQGNTAGMTAICVLKISAFDDGTLFSYNDSFSIKTIPGAGNQLQAFYYDGTSWNNLYLTAGILSIGVPVFIALRKTTETLDMLINRSSIDSIPAVSQIAFQGSDIMLGKHGISSSAFLSGSMYYFLSYNRALTDSEIGKNYDVLRSKLTKRGIVLP